MTRTEEAPPAGRVPIVCWRCGADVADRFDLIRIRGRNVAVHKADAAGCVPTVTKETP